MNRGKTLNKYLYIIDKGLYVIMCLYMITLCIPEIVPVNFLRMVLFLGMIRLSIHFIKIEISTYHLKIVGIFLLALLPSVFFNDVNQNYLEGLKLVKERFISPMIPFFMVLFFVREKNKINYLLLLLLISFFITNIIASWQGMQGITRVYGFTNHYMTLAGLLLLIVPLNLILILSNDIINKYKYVYYITLISAVPAVFFNGTRIVWVGLFISIPIIIWIFLKQKKKAFIYIISLLFISGTFFMSNQYVNEKVNSIFDSSYQSNHERILMWNSAWNMFRDNVIVGVGIGNYPNMYQNKYISDDAIERKKIHPHNVFFYMMAETGVIGTGFLYSMFGYFFVEAFNHWRRQHDSVAMLFLMVMTGIFVQGLTDVNFGNRFYRSLNEIYWFVTGIYIVQTKFKK